MDNFLLNGRINMGFAQIERLGTEQHAHIFKKIIYPPPPEKSGIENTPP